MLTCRLLAALGWRLAGQEVGRGPDLLGRRGAGHGAHGLGRGLALAMLEGAELSLQIGFATTGGDGAGLVGEEVGGDITSNQVLASSFFLHRGEHLAEARITLPDDAGEGGLMSCMGQQLQPGEPAIWLVAVHQVEPMTNQSFDVDALLVDLQHGINLGKGDTH